MRASIVRLVTGFAFVASLVGPTTGARADAFGDRDYIAAIEAYDAGRDDDAMRLLESALSKNLGARERDQAHFFAARTALRLGRWQDALGHVKAIERAMPEIGDFMTAETARAYRAGMRWKEARAAWEKLITRWPDSPLAAEAKFSIADALYGERELAKAETAYTEAIEAHPTSERAATARFNIARIMELTGRFEDAAAGYATLAYDEADDPYSDEAAARLAAMNAKRRAPKPTFTNLVARLDRLLGSSALGEAASALATIAVMAKGQAQQDIIDFRAARLAMKNRDYPAAVARFSALAARASSKNAALEYKAWVAKCYAASDDAEAAVKAYQELADAYQAKAEGRDALYKAAWLAFNVGQYASAVKLFQQYVTKYSRDRQADEAQWYLAWSSYRMGNTAQTLDTLAALRDKYKQSALVPRTYYWQGRVLASLGRAAEARGSYEMTLALAPLDYYGVLARQRLEELASLNKPVAVAAASSTGGDPDPMLLASLETPAIEHLPAAADAPPLARPGTLKNHHSDEIPWGDVIFDWNSPSARRFLRLVALHAYDNAADVVNSLPARPGQDKYAVAYARARMLYALGDFNAAYRITAILFKDEVAGVPGPVNRQYMRIAYPDAHANLVESAAAEFGVSPLLVLAIMRQESAFDDRARSAASANGLMQIIPITANKIAERLHDDEFADAHVTEKAINVRFGTWYLAELMTKFNDNPVLAIASYNAGPAAVSRWVDSKYKLATDEFVEEIPFKETRGYVRRVIGNLAVYTALYSGGQLKLPEHIVKEYKGNVDF